jgi:hypothetical protein
MSGQPLAEGRRLGLGRLAGLALVAGAPAIVGAWIGGFLTNEILAVLFFSVALGAALQVVVEVGRYVARRARRPGVRVGRGRLPRRHRLGDVERPWLALRERRFGDGTIVVHKPEPLVERLVAGGYLVDGELGPGRQPGRLGGPALRGRTGRADRDLALFRSHPACALSAGAPQMPRHRRPR